MGIIGGASTGAAVFGLWTAIPAASQAIGLQFDMSFGVSTFSATTVPTIATAAGYGLVGTNILFGLNEVNQIGTGQNVVADIIFDGDLEKYDDAVLISSILSMGYIEIACSNAGLGSREKKMN